MSPRDGSGQYTQPFPNVVEGTTIESAVYNGFTADVANDLNAPRPIVAGGTGATSADGALDNLSAEKYKQVVTNWDSMVWRAGSFYAATTATGASPVPGHAFAGIAYYANATDIILEATDITDPFNPIKFIRVMSAGQWLGWMPVSGYSSLSGDYTFNSTITFPPAAGQVRFNNATQNSTTEIFISHTTALGIENAGTISASFKAGNDILIQDKDDTSKYKLFTALGGAVFSGSDFRVLVSPKAGGLDLATGERVVISTIAGNAVIYNAAQTLTAAQQSQARANIDMTKKNYIINGAMMIGQENGLTPLGTSGQYAVDMFNYAGGVTSATAAFGQVQAGTPGGSSHRIRITVTGTDVTQDAGDFAAFQTAVEGFRYVDLWQPVPKQMTLRFGVKAPAGIYCVAFRNFGTTRSYVAEYTIAAGEANTDVVKTVTLPATDGTTFEFGSAAGVYITWAFICGSTFRTTPNGWRTGNFMGTANQFNFMGTFGNVFELFDVSLTEGTVAPPFVVPDYANELLACKRYWQRFTVAVPPNPGRVSVVYPPAMRADPTLSGGGAGFIADSHDNTSFGATQTALAYQTITANARL